MQYPPDPERLIVPNHLAIATDCRLLVLPESEWNPDGGTIRLLFKPNPRD